MYWNVGAAEDSEDQPACSDAEQNGEYFSEQSEIQFAVFFLWLYSGFLLQCVYTNSKFMVIHKFIWIVFFLFLFLTHICLTCAV